MSASQILRETTLGNFKIQKLQCNFAIFVGSKFGFSEFQEKSNFNISKPIFVTNSDTLIIIHVKSEKQKNSLIFTL